MIRYLLQFLTFFFLLINKRHDDAIQNEERGRPVGLASSYGKTHKSILLRETFFARLGGIADRGFTQVCFSNFSNNRFFQAEKLPGKTLSARKNIIGNITLSKTSRLTWTNLA